MLVSRYSLLVSNEALGMEIKKEWKTPVILVLVRGTSEENVLDSCKYSVGGQQRPCINEKQEPTTSLTAS
jgi:hypothetical protein